MNISCAASPSRACCSSAGSWSHSASPPPRSPRARHRARRRRRSRSPKRSTTRSPRPAVEGVSANIQLTDHLLEGANLASGGERRRRRRAHLEPAAHRRLRAHVDRQGRPRAPGAAGRKRRHQILYDGHTVSLYDAPPTRSIATRRRPRSGRQQRGRGTARRRPTDTKSRPWRRSKKRSPTSPARERVRRDADRRRRPGRLHRARLPQGRRQPARRRRAVLRRRHGVPLRAAIYSSTSSAPVIELAATAISYGPVAARCSNSRRRRTPRSKKSRCPSQATRFAVSRLRPRAGGDQAHVTTHGHGSRDRRARKQDQGRRQATSLEPLEGLPKVKINGSERHRAAHRARHAAQLRALRRALPARRLGHARGDRGSRARPLA